MVSGKVAYFGSTENIKEYFASMGHPVPAGINLADFIVDLTHDKDDDNSKKNDVPIIVTDIENVKNHQSIGPSASKHKASSTKTPSLPPIDHEFKSHITARGGELSAFSKNVSIDEDPSTTFQSHAQATNDGEIEEDNLLDFYSRSSIKVTNDADVLDLMNEDHPFIQQIQEEIEDFNKEFINYEAKEVRPRKEGNPTRTL